MSPFNSIRFSHLLSFFLHLNFLCFNKLENRSACQMKQNIKNKDENNFIICANKTAHSQSIKYEEGNNEIQIICYTHSIVSI